MCVSAHSTQWNNTQCLDLQLSWCLIGVLYNKLLSSFISSWPYVQDEVHESPIQRHPASKCRGVQQVSPQLPLQPARLAVSQRVGGTENIETMIKDVDLSSTIFIRSLQD